MTGRATGNRVPCEVCGKSFDASATSTRWACGSSCIAYANAARELNAVRYCLDGVGAPTHDDHGQELALGSRVTELSFRLTQRILKLERAKGAARQ